MNNFLQTLSKVALFLACFQVALPAQAIVIDFEWTGDGDGNGNDAYSATGSFTFNDTDGDTFARTGEFTSFLVTFFDPSLTELISYNLSDLQSFNTPIFNFNYDITNNLVLQSGAADSLNGFALGNSQNTNQGSTPTPGGYLLNTNEGIGITFASGDPDSNDFDTGGTVTSTAVPWETDVLPLIGATIFFGGGMWLKRRRATKK